MPKAKRLRKDFGWAIAYPSYVIGYTVRGNRSDCIGDFMRRVYGQNITPLDIKTRWRKWRRSKPLCQCVRVRIIEMRKK